VADKHILHMLSPLKHISPFDVNMALDAGFDAVVPYEGVALGDVTGLVQDAIFSRPPKAGVRTGVFIGGRDALLALDMMEAARKAMVPPFAVSLFADPAGSFTTAAAMVARAEKVLKDKLGRELRGLRLAVFGATGVVGFASGVIAALEGADVTLVGYDGPDRVAAAAEEIEGRFGVKPGSADGSTEEKKDAVLARSDAAFCAGKAGVQILSAEQVRASPLVLVADVNAVPPLGVEGLDVQADGTPLDGGKALGIGALAIGQTKYGTEIGLFKRMIEAAKPVRYDFRDAFALARELAAG
jgi:methylene-tetrahydromethanopterin dehydrogenase